MGWMCTHRGKEPIKEFIARQINCTNESGTWKVLDIAIVKRREAYIACEIRRKINGELANPYVVALVFLIEYKPKAVDGYDTCYKDMDESMGPYCYNCPERILNLLTDLPENDENSVEWRNKCREVLALKKKYSLKKGTVVTTKPIRFSGSYDLSEFRVASLKPLRLWSLQQNFMVRLPRIMLFENIISVV